MTTILSQNRFSLKSKNYMDWYKIVTGIPFFIAGVFIWGKARESLRNISYNDSWKNRKK
ncbi:hypothetical protein [Flavobacterium pedocola]